MTCYLRPCAARSRAQQYMWFSRGVVHGNRREIRPPSLISLRNPCLPGCDRQGRRNTQCRRKTRNFSGRGAKNQETPFYPWRKMGGRPLLYHGRQRHTPRRSPLVLGGLGEGGSAASTTMLFEADTILIAGATWWPTSYTPPVAKIIQIDVAPENIGRNMPVNYGVVGDLAVLLQKITGRLAEKKREQWLDRLHSVKKNWLTTIAPEISAEGSPVPPGYLLKTLEDFIKEDAIITLDTGDHRLVHRLFSGSKQEVLFSGKWRSMGFAYRRRSAQRLPSPTASGGACR